ncbi:MAG: gas vesicle protein K [Candidatus Binatus sp.]|uniref:gas vesicle protein K n=1 Tax=Candidatus Binatus sp. TaxID=2811406 RepID=UPI0027275719|nr:gas vesicle protein K [Candidatus Binatus sp.]MDO8433220.1 gas vesicle protein K [Candidatus Binatus sp.]
MINASRRPAGKPVREPFSRPRDSGFGETLLGDPPQTGGERRINLKPDDLKNGLAQLVLALVNLLHELLERQALARIESGRLSEGDCERLGLTLMRQSEQIDALREGFGLSREDLNIDLGPLGKLV